MTLEEAGQEVERAKRALDETRRALADFWRANLEHFNRRAAMARATSGARVGIVVDGGSELDQRFFELQRGVREAQEGLSAACKAYGDAKDTTTLQPAR